MPLPKRRHSKARTGKKRAHLALPHPHFTNCTHCDAPVAPHSICDKCGYYKDKQLIQIKTKEPKSKS